ncbi:MAG: DUF6065 family protein [Phycisphaerales bacterium]
MSQYVKPGEFYDPGENLPDPVNVPEGEIWVIPEYDGAEALFERLFEPLKGNIKRDWFVKHAYFCLPLTIGNQYGFIVRSAFDVVARWNGGERPEDTLVHCLCPGSDMRLQVISSHFGSGIVTVQNRWVMRTPPGVSLMTATPPNFPLDAVMHMTGVVETDNLRRDFTFNLKITRRHADVFIPKGTPIGCVIPIPRHFVDRFSAKVVTDRAVLESERRTMKHFADARAVQGYYPEGLYMKGMDVYQNRFGDHQRTLDG